jgi:hypothetical protein
MPDYYNAAGSAASDKMEEYLLQREKAKREATMTQLAMQKQVHDQTLAERRLDMEREQHAADLELKRSQRTSIDDERKARQADLIQKGIERKTKEVQDRINGMVPGDIPDAQMVQHADELGLGGQFPQTRNQTMPGVAAPGAGAGPVLPQQGPEPPTQVGLTGAADPLIRPFIGTPTQRQKIKDQQEIDAYAATLPEGSAARQVIEAKRHGVTLTAADLKIDKPATSRRLIFDPVKKQYLTPDGQPVTDVTKDDAVDRSAEPKDTGAKDAARETAQANHVDQIREHAYTELNARAKSTEEQIANLNKFDTSMAQNSNIADSTLAEQIIKITAGGAGSGVRITQPEIDQVLKKSRTVWSDLQMKMNRISADPNAKVFFDEDQKKALRDLMSAIRVKANKTHEKIVKARRDIDDAQDVNTINRTRTSLEEALATAPDPAATAVPGPKRTRYDVNGKVIP